MLADRRLYAMYVAAVCLSVGCRNSAAPDSVGHDHGANGGHLIDLTGGDGGRAEVYFDSQADKLVLRILGPDGRPRFANAQPIQMKLRSGQRQLDVEMQPRQLASEPEGQSSRFECALHELPQQVRVEQHFSAEFTLNVDGEAVSGRLVHEADHGDPSDHD